MKINLRLAGSLMALLGIVALLIFRWCARTFGDPSLLVGYVPLVVGLMLRAGAPDSRARRKKSTTDDALLYSLLGAILAIAWWNAPPAPDAPYHHNDGGDLFAGFLYVPLAWMLITLPLLLLRSGKATRAD